MLFRLQVSPLGLRGLVVWGWSPATAIAHTIRCAGNRLRNKGSAEVDIVGYHVEEFFIFAK